ncbi:hypothetical protein Q664_25080 [Archangium violaceum Cb vi76]|uniref:Uncharacterized protein n=1 Tax=Archangium violaceum Cb vi76 TaxID=1406225 RepID=A0A084SRA8_9BACT|nr:hypothetical protein Q664_25080 [Archangium violaceum Cb vi76]
MLFTANGPRLLDFEYAGMRHALYDALMWLARTLETLEARLRERWTVPPFVWPAFRELDELE